MWIQVRSFLICFPVRKKYGYHIISRITEQKKYPRSREYVWCLLNNYGLYFSSQERSSKPHLGSSPSRETAGRRGKNAVSGKPLMVLSSLWTITILKQYDRFTVRCTTFLRTWSPLFHSAAVCIEKAGLWSRIISKAACCCDITFLKTHASHRH